MTSEPIDIGIAVTVQDLTTELGYYGSLTPDRRVPWPRFVSRLWSKTFVRSSNHRKSLPMPDDLVEQVTALDDPFQTVVVIVGRARAAVSGKPADVEIRYVDEQTRRFLETPEGRERQAYLDRKPAP